MKKKRLDKYIESHLLSSIALVTLMLLGLQCFMLFVSEMGAIGQGDYSIFKALLYVLLKLPYQVYLFFPIACLLGVLLGLGNLATHSELLVMRAHGLSIASIAKVVLRLIGGLVVIVCLLSELSLPKLTHFSEDWKTGLRSKGQALKTAHGLWLRQSDNFVHIDQVKSPIELLGISQYQFNKQHQLVLARYIDKAIYTDKHWALANIETTHFDQSNQNHNKLKVSHARNKIWQLNLNPALLTTQGSEPSEMSLWKLGRLILSKKTAHLDSAIFEINFWRRLFLPITTLVMVLVALPFIFGSTRSVSIGQRLMLGAGLGFLFHVLNEFAIPASQVYQISPLVTAFLPTVLFAVLGAYLVSRR